MNIRFTLLLLLTISTAFAQQEKSISNTDIKQIKIYQNGALVTRTARASVEAGTTKLIIEGLSESINNQSIQVSGLGDVVILSVNHEMNYLNSQKKTAEIIKVERSLDTLNAKLEQVINVKFAYSEEQSMIQSNKVIGGQNNGVTAEHLKSIADIFRNRLLEIRNKLTKLFLEEKKLRDEIQKANDQLAVLNSKQNQPSSNIRVALSAKVRTNVVLEVSYLVNNAGWYPTYDIRAKDIKSPVQLMYKANVYQTTGEEWKDVKLILSTGNPTLGGQRPTLYPWELDFLYPQPKRLYKSESRRDMAPAPMMEKELSQESMAFDKMAVSANSSNYTVVAQNQLSTDFDISLPYSIPSDGKTNLVDVKSYEIPATYNYSAVPKIDRDAFLMAQIIGWDQYNLVSGQANIYFEGSYVGESQLNTESTSDTLDISLGRDKKIVITREKQKDLTSNPIIGSNKVKTLNYEISVRNTKKEEVTIVLEDQVPIAKNADIEIKSIETSGGEYNATTGKVTWKIKLAPSETQKRKLSFTVKYPKDKVVPNL